MATATSRRGIAGLPIQKAAFTAYRTNVVPQSCRSKTAVLKQDQRRGHNTQVTAHNGLASEPTPVTAHNGLTPEPESAPLSPASNVRRSIHSSRHRASAGCADFTDGPTEHPRAPLSLLPLTMILRSLATASVSSSPALLAPSLRIMNAIAHSSNPILNPDRNRLLHFALKKTLYDQFCAGENAVEVNRTIDGIKGLGFTGVMLCYAREVGLSGEQARGKVSDETPELIQNEIAPWAEGTLETVRLAQPGDFVSMKFTGAGRLALHQLSNRLPCSPYLGDSIDAICKLASERGVRVAIDAEQDALQDGIDDWILRFARKYNRNPANPTVFGTYQAYKKCAPQLILNHLADAKKNGYTLGVKMVRGAYLNSDPRERFHDTVEDTHACFDGMTASLLTRSWNSTVPGEGDFPDVSMIIASHNTESVRRARAICEAGKAKSPVAFAQLQGMADEVSCELVEAGLQRQKTSGPVKTSPRAATSTLPTFKYLVWGSTGECMKYLSRRAQENKEAVGRTRTSRDAMWAELIRRCKAAFGIAA
ncbi:proline dehydrogenase-like protein [Emericellopsis cladophorae]|uniref:Proline dehydrogenase n=1 Tax=Emericellopsis cladophorae TaxID=2686198 RepID=A0A9P9Y6X8_9HYPO|nr:proline dehydrogenase-like protein [Emericellopsis cladophorae]KAI6784602.1 proline dehydrogenase-like protein [Emericellopsis cladophorae]